MLSMPKECMRVRGASQVKLVSKTKTGTLVEQTARVRALQLCYTHPMHLAPPTMGASGSR